MCEKKITTLFLDIGGVLLSNGWGHTDFETTAKALADLGLQLSQNRNGHA